MQWSQPQTVHRPSALGAEFGDTFKVRLPEGEDGTFATVEAMRAVVDDAVQFSPHVQRIATAIVASVERNNPRAALDTLWDFLRESIVFKRDTQGTEHLRAPDQLLTEIAKLGRTSADCDDVAMLGASLLRSMGLPAFFVLASRRADQTLEHVFFATRIGRSGDIIPLDPQEGYRPGQWPALTRRVIVPA